MNNKNKGSTGENLVTTWLETQRYFILERNYRKQYGEIDIIACNGKTIAFIEVKTRIKPCTSIAQLVPLSKQKKIIKTALNYLSLQPKPNMIWRFDIALVNETTILTYIQDAFTQQAY